MTPRTEGALSALAAVLVILAAMMNPIVSVSFAVFGLLAYAVYKLTRK